MEKAKESLNFHVMQALFLLIFELGVARINEDQIEALENHYSY